MFFKISLYNASSSKIIIPKATNDRAEVGEEYRLNPCKDDVN